MATEQTTEARRAARLKKLQGFKFQKTGIKHTKPNIIVFIWQGRQIDLRTVSDQVAFLIAKDENCGVLALTKKGEEITSSGEEKP